MKTFLSLAFSLFFTLVTFTSFAQLKVLADGKVGIGTATPDRPLEVVGQILVSNFNTYSTVKQANFLMRHYSDPNTHFNFFIADANATSNTVGFGGGAGSQYAATQLQFWTAPNNTTLLGTERMRVNAAGRVRIGSSGTISHDLTLLNDSAGKPGTSTWTVTSDARVKTNVRPYTDGLEKVLQIEPVFFQYKAGTGYPSNKEFVGVIAQEMQRVAPYTIEEVKVELEEDDHTTNLPETLLTYNSNAVTYMLINAIKEQQSMIQERDEKIEELESRLRRIETMLTPSTGSVPGNSNPGSVTSITLEGLDGAALKQNAPNPFSENTAIEYSLPRTVKNAVIQISNAQGMVMRRVDLPATEGQGILNIKAKELAPGEYVYSLFVNGKVIDTKKMVLINN